MGLTSYSPWAMVPGKCWLPCVPSCLGGPTNKSNTYVDATFLLNLISSCLRLFRMYGTSLLWSSRLNTTRLYIMLRRYHPSNVQTSNVFSPSLQILARSAMV